VGFACEDCQIKAFPALPSSGTGHAILDLVPCPTMHPLQPHYPRHVVSLLASEARFLSLIEEIQHLVPWVRACLSGVETDSRQRIDSLRLLATAHPAELPTQGMGREEDNGLGEVLSARGNSERRALALRLCSRQHRALMNDYRIARELAHRLGHRQPAERIDLLLGRMTDTFPLGGEAGFHLPLATPAG
jgi:hypothetical protein